MKRAWQNVGFVIPALNEEGAIGNVVEGLRARGISQIVVCDNGSTDETASVARSAGATVVHEPERGYGAACLKAISALSQTTEIIGFVDGDGSDNLDDLETLLSPLLREEADFVIASRALGEAEQGALTLPNVSAIGSPHPGSNTDSVSKLPTWDPFEQFAKAHTNVLKCKTATMVGPSKCRSKPHSTSSGMPSSLPTTHAELVSLRSRVLYGERLEPVLKLLVFCSGTISAEVARIHDQSSIVAPGYRVGTLRYRTSWVNNQPDGERGLYLVILSSSLVRWALHFANPTPT